MTTLTYAEALNDALKIMMERDDRVFVFGEDIRLGVFGVTGGLVDIFGEDRVRNTPISEAALAGVAVGAAVLGNRPVLEIQFADVLAISFDHIVNSASKIRYMSNGKSYCPMVVRAPMGIGLSLGMHHSQCVESWFMNVPGLIVVAPSNAADAKGLLISAIECNDPVVFLEHKRLYGVAGDVEEGYCRIPLGKGKIVRPGNDLTIIATSLEVQRALEAADQLMQEGIDVEVIDPRTLRPLDKDLIIESVKKTGRALIVHEAPKFGGFGGELAAILAEEAIAYLQSPILRLAGPEIPVPFGIEDDLPPSVEQIRAAVIELLNT